MKCAYHPEEESVGSCSMCGKPLCKECAEQETGADVLCSRCVALSAARDAVNGESERRARHEEKKSEAARKKGKKSRAAMVVIIILAVLVLIANVYMYIGPDIPEIAQFDPYRDPLLAADLVNDGVEDYAKDHGGKYPEKLTDLLGKYLPYENMTSPVLDMFSYNRPSPTSYVLSFRDSHNAEFSDIVFTKED